MSTNREIPRYIKDFDGWHIVKQRKHGDNVYPTFKERQIWWCSVGVNIGDEMDGKNSEFHRPVLIVRKFNRRIFWGLSMTSKTKDNPYYFPLEFKNLHLEGCLVLSSLRLYDARRLGGYKGMLSEQQFNAVRGALKNLLEDE